MNTYYVIPLNRLSWLQEKIEKLSRKAKRLACPPIALTILETIEVPGDEGEFSRYAIVTVEGQSPRINGWTLVSRLMAVETDAGQAVIIRNAPGRETPAAFRDGRMICDHCQTNRQRKDVFVLVNDAGVYQRVGRNCLSDFLGGMSPEAYTTWAAQWEHILEDLSEMEEDFGERGGAQHYYDILRYLALVAQTIRDLGWLSRSRAKEIGGASTSERAWERLTAPRNFPCPDDPTADDKALSESALAWGRALAGNSEYELNLATSCKMLSVDFKTSGLVASLIPAYHRQLNEESKRQATAASQHFGVVGKREIFTLTVIGIGFSENDWGVITIVNFSDAAGNVAVWFASGNGPDLERGQTCKIKATVKSHGGFRGVKQTILTRCVMIDN